MGQDQDMDDLSREADGDLDVDLTELSLGQRLTALSGGDPEILKERKNKRKGDSASALVPAASLTRTLIQALHSSDTKLLETCLAHSDDSIIRNTVRRLPPQSAVPLLIACMERLGRGARAGTMKGGGGGASSQRGTTLLAWVKAVLAIHNGHLMTMPDLVARLAGLHATLTARLALQESLLSLNGRLDMVLSQIEIRSATALAPSAQSQPSATKSKVRKYREGESDEELMDPEPEIENTDEEGSVEDVELGRQSQEEDQAEATSEEDENSEDESDGDKDENADEEGEDEETDDSETGGHRLNGLIDDEAEEVDEDEDEDSDSE